MRASGGATPLKAFVYWDFYCIKDGMKIDLLKRRKAKSGNALVSYRYIMHTPASVYYR